MDALVDGLLEELNCDVVFKIPIFEHTHIRVGSSHMDNNGSGIFTVLFSRQKSFS